MSTTTKRTVTRRKDVTVAERRKLAKAIPGIMAEYGLQLVREYDYGPDLRGSEWRGWSQRFGCEFEAQFHDGGGPWLSCQFNRPPLYEPWQAGDPRNRRYTDIDQALGGVNPFSGKYNCHIFDRLPADEIVFQFRMHLKSAIAPGP